MIRIWFGRSMSGCSVAAQPEELKPMPCNRRRLSKPSARLMSFRYAYTGRDCNGRVARTVGCG